MYKLKNIANDRFKGAMYRHDGHFGAQMTPHSLRLEPLISNKLMKIGTEAFITDQEFLNCKDVIDTHVNGNVIEVTKISDDVIPVVVVPVEPPPVVVAPTTELFGEAPLAVEKIEEPEVTPLKVEEIVPPVVVEEVKEVVKEEVVESVKKTGKKGR